MHARVPRGMLDRMERQGAVVTAPRAGMRRNALTLYAYLIVGLFTFVMNMQGNVLPFLREGLSLTYWLASLHTSVAAVGIVAAGFAGDHIVRHLGRGRALQLGAAGMVAGTLLLALAPSIFVSLSGCLVIGFFGGLIPAIVYAVFADGDGPSRDAAYAEANAIAAIFAMSAPLSMSLALSVQLPWWTPLVTVAAAFVVLVVAFRGVRVPDGAARERNGGGLTPAYWAYWAMLATGVAVEFCMFLWSPTFLEEHAGLSRTGAAWASSVFFLAMFIGRTAGAGLVRWIPARALLAGALLVAAAGFSIYWTARTPVPAVAGLFVTGLGVSLFFPLMSSLAVGAAENTNAASARLLVGTGLSIMIVPAALGAISDAVGLVHALLAVPLFIVAAFAFFGLARFLETGARVRTEQA